MKEKVWEYLCCAATAAALEAGEKVRIRWPRAMLSISKTYSLDIGAL